MYSDKRKILPLAAVSGNELNFPSRRQSSEKTIAWEFIHIEFNQARFLEIHFDEK